MSAFLYKYKKQFTIILIAIFVISLIPMFMIAGFDAAAGDDYNYGSRAHLAFLSTGSVWASIKAAIDTTIFTWRTWQGTWFDCFLFCLHPEVYSDSAYVIVPYIFIIMQIVTYLVFAHHFLQKKWNLGKWYWLEIALIFLMFSFQLVPSQKSAFFWWVGSIHYAMPICLMLIGIVLADKFITNHKIAPLIGLSIVATLIGGATYPAALLLLLSIALLWLAQFVLGGVRDKRNWFLLIPVCLEIAGLYLSVIAPGNAIRSASDISMGAAPSGGPVSTIIKSIAFSITDAGTSFLGQKAFILIAFIAISMISKEHLLNAYSDHTNVFKKTFSHPILFVVTIFLLNAAAYAPRLYAGDNVSSGYFNFNFWTFFLSCTGIIIYIMGWFISKDLLKGSSATTARSIVIDVLLVALILVIAYAGRHSIKTYTDYVCLDYYFSGQAKDYKDQMKLQRLLMEEEGVDDVIVPEINNEQGPLMHMPIVSDPGNIDNYMTSIFYGKKSCRSIPRDQWLQEYGEKYGY